MLTMKREGEQRLLCLILPPSILPQHIGLKTQITLRICPFLKSRFFESLISTSLSWLTVSSMYLRDHDIFIFSLGAHVTYAWEHCCMCAAQGSRRGLDVEHQGNVMLTFLSASYRPLQMRRGGVCVTHIWSIIGDKCEACTQRLYITASLICCALCSWPGYCRCVSDRWWTEEMRMFL